MCHSETIPAERSIFVSYAHEDWKILYELLKPFNVIERKYNTKLWYDDHLRPGDEWDPNIQIYLTRAPLAILLVSNNFINSNYILDNELPTLLERHSRGEVGLFPVMVARVDLDEIELNRFQTIPPPDRPLKSLKPADREDHYVELAEHVKNELLMRFPAPRSPTAAETSFDARKKIVSQQSPTAFNSAKPLSWKLTVPADLATNEIEHQLDRLVNQTTRRGYLVFSRGAHYVQYAFYKELDPTSVIIEVISNANLDDYPLSKLQVQHLLNLQFTQRSDEENFILLAPVDEVNSLGKLSTITWHILDDVLNCRWGSDLEVSGQCW